MITSSEGQRTDLKKLLVVGVHPHYAPLIFKRNGKLQGIEFDMMEEVAKTLKRKVIYKEMDFEALIPALNKGTIDVIISGLSVTPQRTKLVNFTHSYMDIGQMAIIRFDNIADLGYPHMIKQPGRVIGVQPGTTGESYVNNHLYNASIKLIDTPQQALAALKNGEIEYYIHDAPTSWELGRSGQHPELQPLYHPLTEESLAWAVNKHNEKLLSGLNAALAKLTIDGKLKKIKRQWIPLKVVIP